MIIGICGEAGSGKSTAAAIFLDKGYARGKFAGALKEMLRTYLRYRGVGEETIEDMIEGDLKELPSPLLNGKTPRWAMQSLGTEWGRDCIHPDLWVDTEMDKQWMHSNLLFDDVRHANEESAIIAKSGLIIELIGRGGIEGSHSSEQFKPTNAYQVKNDTTEDEFKAKIERLVLDLSWVGNTH
jgi:hypothetical protein